jgi:hypothetical protein
MLERVVMGRKKENLIEAVITKSEKGREQVGKL